MEISDYLVNALPISILELLAAIFGTLYLRKVGDVYGTKFFVGFLWFTFFFELCASYAPLTFFLELEVFDFIKNTPFENNYWAYNIYFLINYVVYITYFKRLLNNKGNRNIINIIILLFLATSITNHFISDIFFKAFSGFTNIVGTLALMFTISLYYYQLLRSNEVLKIVKLLPFYISVGAIILHLCFTPFLIYSSHFKSSMNPDFVVVYLLVLRITNLVVYSIYILGFIVCRRKKLHY